MLGAIPLVVKSHVGSCTFKINSQTDLNKSHSSNYFAVARLMLELEVVVIKEKNIDLSNGRERDN